MNRNHITDLLGVADAISLVSDITCMAELGENIKLGSLSRLMWLCSDKLHSIMSEVQAELEKEEAKQIKTTLP